MFFLAVAGVFLFLQRHPWFKGLEWDRLYEMEAAFVPEVKDELDTQNFEKFEEVNSEKLKEVNSVRIDEVNRATNEQVLGCTILCCATWDLLNSTTTAEWDHCHIGWLSVPRAMPTSRQSMHLPTIVDLCPPHRCTVPLCTFGHSAPLIFFLVPAAGACIRVTKSRPLEKGSFYHASPTALLLL